ncbi:Uncharacterized protein APZ42_001427 [Daphnia magna]|uniref:Uncharacterized protein n=1 Tax=Daphnia magna TaxID=35525 RepID=A0A164IZV0_9CRUS|nr:Uncharacterized protein APZ42_001427 [Daphnia magna]
MLIMIKSLELLIPYCLVVRIPGSHPGGPGSIPGMGNYFVPDTVFCHFARFPNSD